MTAEALLVTVIQVMHSGPAAAGELSSGSCPAPALQFAQECALCPALCLALAPLCFASGSWRLPVHHEPHIAAFQPAAHHVGHVSCVYVISAPFCCVHEALHMLAVTLVTHVWAASLRCCSFVSLTQTTSNHTACVLHYSI